MKHLTPCQSIKKYCKEQCCVSDTESWKNCKITYCYLHPYRIGKRPSTKTSQVNSIDEKALGSLPFLEKQRQLNQDIKLENEQKEIE